MFLYKSEGTHLLLGERKHLYKFVLSIDGI